VTPEVPPAFHARGSPHALYRCPKIFGLLPPPFVCQLYSPFFNCAQPNEIFFRRLDRSFPPGFSFYACSVQIECFPPPTAPRGLPKLFCVFGSNLFRFFDLCPAPPRGGALSSGLFDNFFLAWRAAGLLVIALPPLHSSCVAETSLCVFFFAGFLGTVVSS